MQVGFLPDVWFGSALVWISLCNLCVLCVSVVYFAARNYHRDTEDTEVAQRKKFKAPLHAQKSSANRLRLRSVNAFDEDVLV